MRILHTSDWHVGKSLARRSRTDEYRAVLAEIAGIAREEDVDLVLVTGDVFEHKVPSPEAEQIVYDALISFERSGIPVLVLPGNHDHPSRWRALRPLFERFHVHVAPDVRRPADGGVITIPSRDGQMSAQIAVLPWVSIGRVTTAQQIMDPDTEPHSEYAHAVERLMGGLCAEMDPDCCTMLAGHLFLSGARPGGGERTLTMGQLFAVDPQAVPQVQYAAFGHVHRPQRVAGTGAPAYYAGSPLQLDFGEAGHDKSVALVDLIPRRPAEVRTRALSAGRRLIEVGGTIEELESLKDEVGDAYLKVTLRCERPQPDMNEQVREILAGTVENAPRLPEGGRGPTGEPPEPHASGAVRPLYPGALQDRAGRG